MPITNNRTHQKNKNIFPNQTNLLKTNQPHGGVGQDKNALRRVRTDSLQPVTPKTGARSQQTDTKSARSQNHSTKRQTVQVAAWVSPALRAELQRMAEQQGISVSQTIGAFLATAVQQELHQQHAALLQPIIEQAIAKHMRAISTRLAWLLVRVAFDAGQTRSLVTNILGRQPGITPQVLQTILEGSGKTAKANITRRTPQIVELIEAVEKWMVADDAKEQTRRA